MIDERSEGEGSRPPAGEGSPAPASVVKTERAIGATTGIDPDATILASRPAHQLQPGEVLGHTYRIEALLGKGGMGAVYRAHHLILDSEHAIKIILSELADDPKFIALMNQEAKALRLVRNDAIVEYQGFMLDETGRRYLVMEFADGPSLGAVLAHRRFTPSEVRTLRDRLAHGLAVAHQKGVFHRDISPDNIILPGGRIESAKIIDFGIAKASEAGEKTIIGSDFSGKYSFASPEQIGMHGGKVDARSDIYSLGLVLAAAAIGQGARLNMGRSLDTIFAARQTVPDLRQIPEDLRDEIAFMLQPRPEDRPQSMEAVAALGTIAGRGESAGTTTRDGGGSSGASRHRRLALAVGSLAFVAAVTAGGAYWGIFTSPPPPAPGAAEEQGPAGQGAKEQSVTGQSAKEQSQAAATSTDAGLVPDQPPQQLEATAAAAGNGAGKGRVTDAVASAKTASDNSSELAGQSDTPPPGNPGGTGKLSAPAGDPGSAPATGAVATLSEPRWNRAALEAQIKAATQGYRCADVRTALTDRRELRLFGFVSTAGDLAQLRLATSGIPDLAAVTSTVAVYEWPHCEVVKVLGRAAVAAHDTAAPGLQFNLPGLVYKGGDTLIVRARETSAYSGYLYVDYFDNEGNAVHMLPTALRPKNTLRAGEEIVLGAPKQGAKPGERIYEIGEPFGPNLVVAIASPKPLFPRRSEEAESAENYLPVLAGALEAAAKGSDPPVVTYAFISTVPK
jgi:serine/threonine protein kinase